MTRGQEETSTSQAGRRRGPSRESPSASSIISSLAIDEMRSYCQILEDIDFELSEGPTEATVGEAYNAVFFTREHLAAGLRFPMSSLVKQFLHFTRAPPAYIHPNVVVDLLNLLPDNSSPGREPEIEAAGRELVIHTLPGQPSSAYEDSGPAPQASKRGERGSCLERPPLARKGPRPTPQVSKKRKGTSGRQKVPRVGVEDFVPWFPPISSHPPDWEEEEEEGEMSDLVHNFAALKWKRDASFKRAINAIPEVTGGEGPDVQAIVISGSPEMGSNDQPGLENATLVESGEASPTSAAIQVIHFPEQDPGQLERPLHTQTERSRPRLPDRLLVNSYHPPRSPTSPMGEVLAPGPKGAQEIIN